MEGREREFEKRFAVLWHHQLKLRMPSNGKGPSPFRDLLGLVVAAEKKVGLLPFMPILTSRVLQYFAVNL